MNLYGIIGSELKKKKIVNNGKMNEFVVLTFDF